MKYYGFMLIALTFLCSINRVDAKIGCMSKTLKLANIYDYKTPHYVECSCPCGSAARYKVINNVCIECGHFHRAQVMRFIKGSIPRDILPLSQNPVVRFFQKKGSLIFN